ncbi:MAG TPA: hypothetical protein VIG89_00315 [Candidatus Acidoferrales bacterium]
MADPDADQTSWAARLNRTTIKSASIPRESIDFTLQSTRAAVLGEINETHSSK